MKAPPPLIASALRLAAGATQVPYTLLAAIAWVESRYNPKAVSPVGAAGLMQLMPGTARALGVTDSFDAQQNARGGATFMRTLLRMFDGSTNDALAAYNWGPARVKTAKREGRSYPAQVQGYVAKVLAAQLWLQKQAEPGGATDAERLNNAIVTLAQLNAGDPRIQKLSAEWDEWWNGPRRLIADSVVLQHPVLQAFWYAYSLAYDGAAITSARTPHPEAINPELWPEVARVMEQRAAAVADAAASAGNALLSGAGIGLAAVLLVLVLTRSGSK